MLFDGRHAVRKVVPAEQGNARNPVIPKVDDAHAMRGAIAQALVYGLFLHHDLLLSHVNRRRLK